MTRTFASLAVAATLMAAVLLPAAAQNAPATASSVAPAREQPAVTALSDERQARDWGLPLEDWARYRELMQGPLGVLSPNLDPLTALGIESRSDAERARYAELQVRFEARRAEKTLAYQRAYDAAWQRIFPGQPRVTLSGAPPSTDAGSGRLAVFVKADCAPCEQRVLQLQTEGAAFDLYMVGSRLDDDSIRSWARRAGVDPARVRAGAITLNHDAGRWLSLGLAGDLPAVVQEIDGQWQRR